MYRGKNACACKLRTWQLRFFFQPSQNGLENLLCYLFRKILRNLLNFRFLTNRPGEGMDNEFNLEQLEHTQHTRNNLKQSKNFPFTACALPYLR